MFRNLNSEFDGGFIAFKFEGGVEGRNSKKEVAYA